MGGCRSRQEGPALRAGEDAGGSEPPAKRQKLAAQDLDRKLLERAQELSTDGVLDLQDARRLWRLAAGWGVTDKEARTLQHLLLHYAFDEGARIFLSEKLRDRRQQEVPAPPGQGPASVTPLGGDFVPVFYNPGNAGFAELVSTLRSARKSLDLCLFTLSDDRLAAVVLELHKAGVVVRIIGDDDSHRNQATSDLGTLEKAGIEVRFDQKPIHMHHKFALIDGKVCLHGSLNWTTGALRNNNENIIITRCGHIADSFAAEFKRLWAAFAPGAAVDESLAPDGVWKDDVIVLFFPDQKDRNFRQLVDIVAGAQKTLDVAMFTLVVPDLVSALQEAHRRGVRVRVITDDRQAQCSKHCRMRVAGLRDAGVEVRTDQSPANMHHKFCVVDGRTLCNGSYNWTRQGKDGNYENVVIYRKHAPLARSFAGEFERLWKRFAVA